MVNDHSFAQGPIAGSQSVDAESAHCAFEYLTTSYNDLGALRTQPGNISSLGDAHLSQFQIEHCQLVQRNLRLDWLRLLFLPRHIAAATRTKNAANCQDRSGSAGGLLPTRAA